MQKIFFMMGVGVLAALVYWNTSSNSPQLSEVVLANVEALADIEWAKPPTICRGSGDLTCPGRGEKYQAVYQGYGLNPDEETY